MLPNPQETFRSFCEVRNPNVLFQVSPVIMFLQTLSRLKVSLNIFCN